MFKEFCAFRNYGLTDVEKKKYEQLKIRLKQQKDHPSLGLGYIPSMNQVPRLTKCPKQCLLAFVEPSRADSVHELEQGVVLTGLNLHRTPNVKQINTHRRAFRT